MKLPNNESAVADVRNFVEDNHVKSKRGPGPMLELEELTHFEFLDYYLQWNGIMGYTGHVVDLLLELGWKAPTYKSPRELYEEHLRTAELAGTPFEDLPQEAKIAWKVFADAR